MDVDMEREAGKMQNGADVLRFQSGRVRECSLSLIIVVVELLDTLFGEGLARCSIQECVCNSKEYFLWSDWLQKHILESEENRIILRTVVM